MTKRFTSRSAVLSFNTCPRKRYFQYHLNNTGVVSEKYPLDLLIGSTVHRGLQHLLEHCRKHKPYESLSEECVNEAVEKAYEIWRETLSQQSLWLNSNSEEQYLADIIAEQECLFEGLIRAFAAHRLPYLLAEYEILEVEHEEVYDDFSNSITFLGKADGLFKRKKDNKLVVLSIKTSSEYADVTVRNIIHDMQGVSEWVIIQDRLDKLFERYKWLITNHDELHKEQTQLEKDFDSSLSLELRKYISDCYRQNQKPEIFAVQYEHLLKGKRRQYPYQSGIYKQDSFLIHPIKQTGLMLIGSRGTSFSADEYKWKKPSGKLGKGWELIDIYNDIGIKNWIELLATGQIQPEEGHPFDTIIKTSDLIIRSQAEIEEWKVSTAFQEEIIGKHLNEIDIILEDIELAKSSNDEIAIREFTNQLQTKIWQYFPKDTTSCHNFYGKDCVFVTNCHENITIEDSISAGVLIPRVSHHDLERETIENAKT